jgi:hypothetical protein
MRGKYFLIILNLFLVTTAYPQENIAEKEINVSFQNIPLIKAIRELHEEHGILFTYSESKVPAETKINISGLFKLSSLFDEITRQTGIRYTIINNQVVLYTDLKKQDAGINKFTIKGFISDSTSGETLIGAMIYIDQLKTGQVTNLYGYYAITLPAGHYKGQVTYVGFKTYWFDLYLNSNSTMNFKMKPQIFRLADVIVKDSAMRDKVQLVYMGFDQLNLSEAGSIPALLGEPDIVGLLMTKAGVQSINEGTSGLHVRGGDIHDNTFQLDEAPLFNVNHLGGIYSVFNSDALKSVTIYKGIFPADYGGGLSSIVDVRMKEGNQSNYACKGGIGLISSRFMIEGPIKKEKSSFLISIRRSYLDNLLRVISKEKSLDITKFYFTDINAKANITLDNRNRLFFSGYYGNDLFSYGSTFEWGNILGVVRWNHVINDKLFMNTTLIRSYYSFNITNVPSNSTYKWKSLIDSYTGKVDFNLYTDKNICHEFGFIGNYILFSPVKVTPYSENSFILPFKLEPERIALYNLYYQIKKQFPNGLSFNFGSRFNLYQKLGPGSEYKYTGNTYSINNISDTINYGNGEIMYNYANIEPRANISYMFNTSSSVKLAYARTTSYIHGFSLSSLFLTFDRLVPSSVYIKPGISDVYSIGYFNNLIENALETSAEVYYKKIYNLTECEISQSLFIENHLEKNILIGTGKAYGIELTIAGKTGRLQGKINYTWSRVRHKIENINNNESYPPYYDREHDVNLNLQFSLTKRITVSSNTVYLGGRYINMPVGQYIVDNKVVPQFKYNHLNLKQLPPYFRLDMGISISGKQRPLRHWRSRLDICLYNLYFKNNYIGLTYQNVFNNNMDLTQQDAGTNFNQSLKPLSVSFSSFIPSITYNFSF